MKRPIASTALMGLSLLTWFLLAPAGAPLGPAAIEAAPMPSDGVVVYQFHRRFRCQDCHTLEAIINETLRTHFPEEVKSGRIVFLVVDLDAEGNGHYEKDYRFFYNTVIMVDMEGGSEARFKNLEEVWSLVHEKDAAMEFIRSHVAEYL